MKMDNNNAQHILEYAQFQLEGRKNLAMGEHYLMMAMKKDPSNADVKPNLNGSFHSQCVSISMCH